MEPLPGFPDDGESSVDEAGLFHSMRSTASPALRFIVAGPGALFPDHAPPLGSTIHSVLGSAEC